MTNDSSDSAPGKMTTTKSLPFFGSVILQELATSASPTEKSIRSRLETLILGDRKFVGTANDSPCLPFETNLNFLEAAIGATLTNRTVVSAAIGETAASNSRQETSFLITALAGKPEAPDRVGLSDFPEF
jgi:hypothetical protein